MSTYLQRSRARQIKAAWRDIWLLLGEFGTPLLIFIFVIIGGGIAFYLLSAEAGEPLGNLLEAFYSVLAMTFLQNAGEFPHTWYLGIFYFVMPVIGVIILAQGITEFSVMLFNRRARGKDWEVAVASTYSNHIILVGLGHLGFRVAEELIGMEQDIVIIESNPKADLTATVKKMGVPVIQDDASHEVTLESAGVRHARAIILCMQNDSLNLKIALKARRLNPAIHVILRIFDDDFAQGIQEQFGYSAFSATGMAAPAFAAAASGMDITRPIMVEGQPMSLAHLTIDSASTFINKMVSEIEQNYKLSVVFIRRDGTSDFHPPASSMLSAHDELVVLGGLNEIHTFAGDNRPPD